MASSITARTLSALLAAALAMVAVGTAVAQFGPPSTFLGTVADEQGLIREGDNVEAYVGETLCSFPSGSPTDAMTFPYGEGDGRVLFYTVDVVSAGQRSGCGRDGSEVRVKIGDRFANETALWRAGPIRLDLTFGEIEPAVQPTATPTPTSEPQSPTPTPATVPTQAAGATSSPSASADDPTPVATSSTPSETSTPGGAEVRPGGLDSTADAANFDDGGSFPLSGILLVALGAVALVGGAVGIIAAQRNREEDL